MSLKKVSPRMSRVSHPNAQFETLPCKDDCVARIEEEERLSVRIYDIGQSRDSRCQYKFNEDASIEDKDFIPFCRLAVDTWDLNRTECFTIEC